MATDKELQILIKAKDEASAVMKEALKTVQALTKELGSVKTLKIDFSSNIKQVAETTQAEIKAMAAAEQQASKERIALAQAEAKTKIALAESVAKQTASIAAASSKVGAADAAAQAKVQAASIEAAAKTAVSAQETAAKQAVATTQAQAKAQVAATEAAAKMGVAAQEAAAKQAVAVTQQQTQMQTSLIKGAAQVQTATIDAAARAQAAAAQAQARQAAAQVAAEARTQAAVIQATARENVAAQQSAARAAAASEAAMSRERVAAAKNAAQAETAAMRQVSQEQIAMAKIASQEGIAAQRARIMEMEASTKAAAVALRQEAQAAQTAAKATNEVGEAAHGTSSKFHILAQDTFFAGIAVSTGLTAPLLAGAKAIIGAGSSFEDAFAGVRKAVDTNDAGFAKLNSQIREMAMTLPVSRDAIAQVAEEAGYLGISADNILKVADAAIRMGESSDIATSDALNLFGRLAAVFNVSQEMIPQMMSNVVALGISSAATESDIANMAFRIAGAANIIGLTIPQTFAFADALASMGVKAEMGGSSISRVMETMAKEVETGGDNLALFAQTAGMSADQFVAKWKSDPLGALMGFIDGLGQMKEQSGPIFDLLDSLSLDGIRVTDILLRMASNTGLVAKAQETANKEWGSTNTLMDVSNKRFGTASAQLVMLKSRFSDLFVTIYNRVRPMLIELIKDLGAVADACVPLVDAFTRLPDSVILAVTAFAALVAAAGPVLLAMAGIFQILTIAGGGTITLVVGLMALTAVLVGVLAASTGLSEALKGGLLWTFVLLRDTIKTFRQALDGEWVRSDGIRRVHLWAGEWGNFARGVKEAIQDIERFGRISSGTMLMFDQRIRPALTAINIGLEIMHRAFDSLGRTVRPILAAIALDFKILAETWDAKGFLATLALLPLVFRGIAHTISLVVQDIDWAGIGNAILGGFSTISTNVGSAVYNWVKGQVETVDWSGVATTIQSKIADGFDLVTDLESKLTNWILAQIDKVKWSDVINTIGKNLGNAIDKGPSIASRFGGWIEKEIGKIKLTPQVGVAIAGAIGSALGGVAFGPVGALVGGILGRLIGTAISKLDFSKVNMENVGSTIASAFSTVFDAGVDLATTIYNWISGEVGKVDWKSLGTSAAGYLSTAWDTTVDLATTLGKWLGDQAGKIDKDTFKAIGTTIANGINDNWDTAVDIGKTILGWIDSGLKALEDQDWKGIADYIGGKIKGAAETSQDAFDAGKKFAQRVEQGILSYNFRTNFSNFGKSIDLGLKGTSLGDISGSFRPIFKFIGQLGEIVKDPAIATFNTLMGNIGASISILKGDVSDFVSGLDTKAFGDALKNWGPPLEKIARVDLTIFAGGLWLLGQGIQILSQAMDGFRDNVIVPLNDLIRPGQILAGALNNLATGFGGAGRALDGILTVLGGLKDIVTGNFADGWKQVKDGVKEFFDALPDVSRLALVAPVILGLYVAFKHIKELGKVVWPALGRLPEIAADAFHGAVKKAKQAWDWIKGIFSAASSYGWPDLGDLPSLAADTFHGAVKKAKQAWDWIKDVASAAARYFWPDLNDLPSLDADTFHGAVKKAKEAWKWIEDIASAASKYFWPDLGDLPSVAGDIFYGAVLLAKDGWDLIKSVADNAKDYFWPVLGALPVIVGAPFLVAVLPVIAVYLAIKQLVSDLKDISWPDLGDLPKIAALPFILAATPVLAIYIGIKAVVDALKGIGWPDLGDLPIPSAAKTFVQVVGDVLGIYDRIKSLAGKIFSFPDINFPDFGGGGDKGGSSFLDKIKGVASDPLGSLKKLITDFKWPDWPAIPNPDFSKVAAFISGDANGANLVGVALNAALVAYATVSIMNMQAAMDSAAATYLPAASTNVAMQAVSGLGTLYTDAYNAGTQLDAGLAQGINDSVGVVTAAASGVAAAAHAAINTTSQIQSPSKVTMQSGQFFGEGFAIGIQSMTPLVVQAATELANAGIHATRITVDNLDQLRRTANQGIGGNNSAIASATNTAGTSAVGANNTAIAAPNLITQDAVSQTQAEDQRGQQYIDFLKGIIATLNDAANLMSDDALAHLKTYEDSAKGAVDLMSATLDFINKLGDQVIQYGDWQEKNIANLKFITEKVVTSLGDSAALMSDDYLNHTKTYADAATAGIGTLVAALDFVMKLGDQVILYGDWQDRNIANLKFIAEKATASVGDSAQTFGTDYLQHIKDFTDATDAAITTLGNTLDLVQKLSKTHELTVDQLIHIGDVAGQLAQAARIVTDQFAAASEGFVVTPAAESLNKEAGSALSTLSSVLDFFAKLTDNTKKVVTHIDNLAALVTGLSSDARLIAESFAAAAVGFDQVDINGVEPLQTTVSAALDTLKNTVDLLTIFRGNLSSLNLTTRQIDRDVDILSKDAIEIARHFAAAAKGFDQVDTSGVEPLQTAVGSALDTIKNTLELLTIFNGPIKAMGVPMAAMIVDTAFLAHDAVLIAATFAHVVNGFQDVDTAGVEPLTTAIGNAVDALKNTIDLLNAMADDSKALTVSPETVKANARNLAQKARQIADAFKDATKGWDTTVDPAIEGFSGAVSNSTGALGDVLSLMKDLSDGPVRALYVSPEIMKQRIRQLRDLAVQIATEVSNVNWGETVNPKLEAFATDVQNATGILTNAMDLLSKLQESANPGKSSDSKPVKVDVKAEVEKLLGNLDTILTEVLTEAENWNKKLGDVQTFAQTVQSVFDLLNSVISMSGISGQVDLSGVKDALGQVVGIFESDLFQQLITLFEQYAPIMNGKGVDIGKNVGDGVATGLDNSRDHIMSVVDSIAQGIEDRFKQAMQIQSPSKVMEPLGEDTGRGLIVGMHKIIPSIRKAAEAMAAPIKQVSSAAINASIGTAASQPPPITGDNGIVLDPHPLPTFTSAAPAPKTLMSGGSGGGSTTGGGNVGPVSGGTIGTPAVLTPGGVNLGDVFSKIVGSGNWLTAAYAAAKVAGGFQNTNLDEEIQQAAQVLGGAQKMSDIEQRNFADQLAQDWEKGKAPYGATADPGTGVDYLGNIYKQWVGNGRDLEATLSLVQKAAGGYNNTHADEQLVWADNTLAGKNKPDLLRYFNVGDALQHNMQGLGIPKLAAGGIVDRTTLAMIGEAGQEAVLPLSPERLRPLTRGVADGMIDFISDASKRASKPSNVIVANPIIGTTREPSGNGWQGAQPQYGSTHSTTIVIGNEKVMRVQEDRQRRKVKTVY